MDFGLRSAQYGMRDGEEDRCEITSLFFQRQGRYDFGITLQGTFIHPRRNDSNPDIQPRDFHTPFFSNNNMTFDPGLQVAFLTPPNGGSSGRSSDESQSHDEPPSSQEDLDFNHLDADVSSDFDFSSFMGSYQPSSPTDYSPQIPTPLPHHNSSQNEPFSSTSPSTPTVQELVFSPEPSSSQEESNSTSTTRTGKALIKDQTRHKCRICTSTFKRTADLRRHSRMHDTGERSFHCREPDCPRNGRKRFYRRDKLLTHQRQMHRL